MWRRRKFAGLLAAVAVAWMVAPSASQAAGLRGGRGCGVSGCGVAGCGAVSYGGPCVDYELVERTIHVPQMVVEPRMVTVVEHRPEVRQRTVTVVRRVPETQPVTREYTVMVPEQRMRTVEQTVARPVWREVTQQYTVPVPEQVVQTSTRTVCKRVPVQTVRVVCEDQGHWQEVACDPCGGGSGCGYGSCCGNRAPRKVWVPQIVQREVPVTVWKTQMEQVPYQYTTTVYRPEVRTRQQRVCEMQTEVVTREVPYTVCVPTVQSKTFNVTTVRCVPEEQQVDYTVMVPHQVQKEVAVRVCKMVPKQVVCRVPVARAYPDAVCCP